MEESLTFPPHASIGRMRHRGRYFDSLYPFHTMLKVAIFERDRKTVDELKAYIVRSYYGQVETVDGSVSDKHGVDEMRKFKPDLFILGQMGNPQTDFTDLSRYPEKFEIERHIEACKLVLATFERRPYLVAICGDDGFTRKQYQKFKARCEEWGYDVVYRRSEVNSASISLWVNHARRSGGANK